MPQVVDLRKIKKVKKIKVETEESKEPKPEDATPTKLEWLAPEFVKYERSKSWFIVIGIIALVILAFSVLTKNFLLAVATDFNRFVIYIYSKKEPRKIKFSISGKGFRQTIKHTV